MMHDLPTAERIADRLAEYFATRWLDCDPATRPVLLLTVFQLGLQAGCYQPDAAHVLLDALHLIEAEGARQPVSEVVRLDRDEILALCDRWLKDV